MGEDEYEDLEYGSGYLDDERDNRTSYDILRPSTYNLKNRLGI